jgi:hypothetical protein
MPAMWESTFGTKTHSSHAETTVLNQHMSDMLKPTYLTQTRSTHAENNIFDNDTFQSC